MNNSPPIRACLSFVVAGVPVTRDTARASEDLTTVREFLFVGGMIVDCLTVERWRTEHLVAVPAAVTR